MPKGYGALGKKKNSLKGKGVLKASYGGAQSI